MSNDVIVAARVPEEIKEQGNATLAKLGLTPTQLINSAYRYVLEFQKLPFESAAPKPGARWLEVSRMQQIAEELTQLQVSTYDYSQGETLSFKDALAGKIRAEYEKQS
jgi:addiction module RelB/DinJ family antitoxin